MPRVALVAGASSGLGRAVAERLARDGFTVFAGARSFATGREAPAGCVPVALDVTDDASVKAAVARALSATGRLDALVCCAAVLTLGPCEETTVDELRAVMETNYLGAARMAQAALPAMRAQGGGRVALFSSLNGRFAVPYQGAYTASKHAVEGFAEALAMEARRFGVRVTVVEPGDCRGGSEAYRGRAERAQAEDSPYRPWYRAAVLRICRDEAHGLPQEKVAAAVSRALTNRRAPARVVVARIDQRLALWLHGLLPRKVFFRILEWYYGPKGGNRHPD